DDNSRPDHGDLGLQPRKAGFDLDRAGFAVDPPRPARHPLEVFDGVGDVDPRPIDSALDEAAVEQSSRGPTKGFPAMSSTSPGCSPTNISSEPSGPSPNTV